MAQAGSPKAPAAAVPATPGPPSHSAATVWPKPQHARRTADGVSQALHQLSHQRFVALLQPRRLHKQ